jgi:outer membrane lipoprotein-sorting protein
MKLRTGIIAMIIASCLFISLAQGKGEAANILGEIYKQLGLSQNITYSADMVIQTANQNGMPEATKVFFKNGNIRTEGKQGAVKFISIIRTDGTVYSCMESSPAWIKSDLGEAMKGQPLPQYKQVGTESLDGKSCLKYEMSDPQNSMSGLIWVSEGMIVKNQITVMNETTTVLYQNINNAALDDSLFMPPPSAKVQDMASMMQGMAPDAAQQ